MKLEEVFKICHKGVAGGHRGVAATLDKFQRTFVVMSAREKICRLVDGSNTCLVKERSIQAKRGPHMPSTVGNVGGDVVYRLSFHVRNCEKESLFTNSTGWGCIGAQSHGDNAVPDGIAATLVWYQDLLYHPGHVFSLSKYRCHKTPIDVENCVKSALNSNLRKQNVTVITN